MKIQCMLCGEFQSENRTVVANFNACYDCIESLVDNEVERRGELAERKAFEGYHSGTPTIHDRERDEMREAGRIP